MSLTGGGAPRRKESHPHETGNIPSKSSALLGNLKAHARAVQGSRGAGWTVCRFHGARGGAPKGKANGAYKHGLFTAEAIEERRALHRLMREARQFVRDLGK